MAFPSKGPSMPPPGADKKPDVAIAIGVPKPKEGGDPSDGGDGKDSKKLEGAGVIRADHHCQQCENWSPETGDCKELPGTFDADDACVKYFEPMGDSSDPNEAAEGEGDESGAMPPPEPVGAQA